MQTSCQGKYFEFLTKEMREKPIETVDELEERKSIVFMEFVRVQTADGFAAELILTKMEGFLFIVRIFAGNFSRYSIRRNSIFKMFSLQTL